MRRKDHTSYMRQIFQAWCRDESGATAIEYGLIAALIALSVITGASTFSASMNETFDDAVTILEAP